jgi:hypothetical protein
VLETMSINDVTHVKEKGDAYVVDVEVILPARLCLGACGAIETEFKLLLSLFRGEVQAQFKILF